MLNINEIIIATNGRSVSTTATEFTGISTDSRNIRHGELFIPLIGLNFDGHDFIKTALDSGAAGVLVQVDRNTVAPEGSTIIEVNDTTRALQDIAHFIRMARPDLVTIGVTGTNGKTTTKEMLAAILSVRGPVLKNEGNLNNGIGVPLTLLRLESAHWAAVIEMGMNDFGEIARLAEIAQPGIGVITNIGPGHLEKLGSIAGVARAKTELIEKLPATGKAILNADDPYMKDYIAKYAGMTITYGLGQADITASDIRESDDGITFKLRLPGLDTTIRIKALGLHNVYNALAACAAAYSVGMTAAEVHEGLKKFKPVKMRMEMVEINGVKVINDAYNANPASMAAALTMLASVKNSRRIAVLGDMMELGESSMKSHHDLGRLAGAEELALLIIMGAFSGHVAAGAEEAGMPSDRVFVVSGPEEAAVILTKKLTPGDHLLVKGSRSMKMERIIDLLKSRRLVA